MGSIYVGDFEGKTEAEIRATIVEEYEVDSSALDGLSIIAAAGECWCYDEGHWFLLRREADGALLENDAGHCSCYGFEGQWSPTETSVAALLTRKTITSNAPSDQHDYLRAFIEAQASHEAAGGVAGTSSRTEGA